MFKNQPFYYQHVRKAIIAFGTLFNNIRVRRTNSDGDIVNSMYVPLSYAPKQKFLSRIQEFSDLENRQVAVTLPRIGFEITDFSYDAARKLTITQPVRALNQAVDEKGIKYSFVSTPWNMGISMGVFAKNQDDGLQIVEQILPYFNPDFNVTINELPELGVRRDIQIVLNNVSYNDDWESDFSKRLSVNWELNFTMKINLFGYVKDASYIKKVFANIYTDTALFEGTPSENKMVGRQIYTSFTPDDALPTEQFTYIQEFDDIYRPPLEEETTTTTTTIEP